jgi:hypothetical protein
VFYPLVILVGILVLAAVAAVLAKRFGLLNATGDEKRAEKLPYRKRDYLLTKAERSFYDVLCASLDGRWTVFAKVRLSDLVWLPKGTQNVVSHRNRVQSKHVDFVVCDRTALKPVLVIELDDASHDREDRQTRDALVDRVLASAALPVLHVRAQQGYALADVKSQIDAALAPGLEPR